MIVIFIVDTLISYSAELVIKFVFVLPNRCSSCFFPPTIKIPILLHNTKILINCFPPGGK